ncbi:hypothetical protein GGU10DRAFT_335487, partial [Lentinula aff. detonsa]
AKPLYLRKINFIIVLLEQWSFDMAQRTTRSRTAAMLRQTRSGQPLESFQTLSQVERDNRKRRKAKSTISQPAKSETKGRGRTVGKTLRTGKEKKQSKEESDVAQRSSEENNDDETYSPPPRHILHRSNALPVLSAFDNDYEPDTASRPPTARPATHKPPKEVPQVILYKRHPSLRLPKPPAKRQSELSSPISPRVQHKAEPPGSPSVEAYSQEMCKVVAFHQQLDTEYFSNAARVDFKQAGVILDSLSYSLFSLASVEQEGVAYVPSDQRQTAARLYAWKSVRSLYNKLRSTAHSEWTELILTGNGNNTAFTDSDDFRALVMEKDEFMYELNHNTAHTQWEELAALPATLHFSPRSSPIPFQETGPRTQEEESDDDDASLSRYPHWQEGEQVDDTFSPAVAPLVDYSSEAGTVPLEEEEEEEEEEENTGLTKDDLQFTAEFEEDKEVEEVEVCSDDEHRMDGDEDNHNTDQADDDIAGSAPGRLSKEFKARLNEIQERYRESVVAAAREAGKDVQVCWQYLEEGARQPRSINRWNAFKAWWASNGNVERAPDESLSTWNKFLKSKYLEVLRSRLSDDDLNDPEARSKAMKPEVDWYRNYINSYYVAAKDTGRVRTSVKQIMRPLVNLAKKINDTTGYHILSFVITTATDSFGRSLSAFVAGDEVARLAKEAFESKIVDQIRDLEAYVRLTEIDNRNVSAEKESIVITEVCLGEDLPSDTKLDFNNFLSKAWMFKVRVIDWSSLKFPKHNIQTVGNFSTNDVRGLVIPRKLELERENHILTKGMDDSNLTPTCDGVPFKLECWSDDEQVLAEEDMGNVALVVGTNNETLVSVSDVQSWQAVVGGLVAKRKGQRANSAQGKLSLYASDSEEETAVRNKLLKKALARHPPPPPPHAHHQPPPSLHIEALAQQPLLPPPNPQTQALPQHLPLPLQHSHPTSLARRVPPPSLQIQPPPHSHPDPPPHPSRPRPRPLSRPVSQLPPESGLKRKRDAGIAVDDNVADSLAAMKKRITSYSKVILDWDPDSGMPLDLRAEHPRIGSDLLHFTFLQFGLEPYNAFNTIDNSVKNLTGTVLTGIGIGLTQNWTSPDSDHESLHRFTTGNTMSQNCGWTDTSSPIQLPHINSFDTNTPISNSRNLEVQHTPRSSLGEESFANEHVISASTRQFNSSNSNVFAKISADNKVDCYFANWPFGLV